MKLAWLLALFILCHPSQASVYKVGAYEIDGVDLANPQEVNMSVENINTTTSIYSQSNLTQILEYLKVYTTYVSSTSAVNTTSTTFQTATGMTLTPASGIYIIVFSGSVETTGTNTQAEIALFKNSTEIAETNRTVRNTAALLGIVTLSTNNGSWPAMTFAKVTASGTDVFTMRYRHVSGGSITINQRNFLAVKVPE